MKFKYVLILVLFTAGVTAGGMYLLMDHGKMKAMPMDGAPAQAERKIIYWKAPMDPTEIYDEPGKSKMGMDLVPVYEDEVDNAAPDDPQVDGVDVSISAVVEQNMGLKVEAVLEGPLDHTIQTYGHITFDETRTAQVSPRFEGWIQKLYVDYTGKAVEKGDALFTVYSPALVASQEEFLIARRNHLKRPGAATQSRVKAARERLIYYGIAGSEIRKLEKTGQVIQNLVFRSPHTGVVVVKNAVEGGFIKKGSALYTIVDLSVVWVEAHIFEYEQNLVYTGQAVEMQLSYDPNQVRRGKIAYIFPYLQPKTRDVVIRMAFDNKDGMLR
ncbi:MAG: efflux RND transporter periplasmic adaptor subunit, partial [Desulfobacterales bacterium]|nr:efflux RND transporter periplasmic adaptor subunit [Desulfobacterales bacterium]